MFIDEKMYLNIEDEHIKEKNLKKKIFRKLNQIFTNIKFKV